MQGKLIFVYNADSGLFNTAADIVHKIFSPKSYSCRLCALSHDYFTVRREWRAFIDELGIECEFIHRDELAARLPGLEIALPAILKEAGGKASLCLSAEALNQCLSMAELTQAIRRNCLETHL